MLAKWFNIALALASLALCTFSALIGCTTMHRLWQCTFCHDWLISHRCGGSQHSTLSLAVPSCLYSTCRFLWWWKLSYLAEVTAVGIATSCPVKKATSVKLQGSCVGSVIFLKVNWCVYQIADSDSSCRQSITYLNGTNSGNAQGRCWKFAVSSVGWISCFDL